MISRDEQHQNVVDQYELPHPFNVVSKNLKRKKRKELDDQHPIQPMISQSTDPQSSPIANSIGEQIPSSGPPLANGHATSSTGTADADAHVNGADAHQSPLLHPHNQSLPLEGPQPSIDSLPYICLIG